jgi:hypothetical protein
MIMARALKNPTSVQHRASGDRLYDRFELNWDAWQTAPRRKSRPDYEFLLDAYESIVMAQAEYDDSGHLVLPKNRGARPAGEEADDTYNKLLNMLKRRAK